MSYDLPLLFIPYKIPPHRVRGGVAEDYLDYENLDKLRNLLPKYPEDFQQDSSSGT